ncbi:UNVERIFIED_CONTAM: Tyrosine aminotransferase [Sesamum radiatum]|uniref:Tyrosine aminotransferase n=1 Tax=Sesamum radiatum TaxID=300843 RepID=A0AAW2T5H3_SESRA
MENGGTPRNHWRLKRNEELTQASALTIRGVLNMLTEHLNASDPRPVIQMGQGDPSAFPSFRTTPLAEDAVWAALRSAIFNGYSSTVGIPPARR